MTRRYLLIGALFGASGVALSAAAAHVEAARTLNSAALMLLMHGTLLVSLALQSVLTLPLRLAAATLALGTTLFAADLTLFAFKGLHVFPSAAPTGGTIMIVGWLMLVLAAFKWQRT